MKTNKTIQRGRWIGPASIALGLMLGHSAFGRETKANDEGKAYQEETVNNIPKFLPVVGNHDMSADGGSDAEYMKTVLIPALGDIATPMEKGSANYYVDWKNVRFILVDQYSWGEPHGNIPEKGREWVRAVIESAVEAEHIFIAFHEPAFPQGRHVGDSFDQFPNDRDAFWEMIMKHRDKVRAVFNGHTHHYSVLQVADWRQPNKSENPDPNGIYQLDCGQASPAINSRWMVRVAGPAVFIYGASKGELADQMAMNADKADTSKAWSFAAVSDPQYNPDALRGMAERIQGNKDPEIKGLEPVDLVLVVGDMPPAKEQHEAFCEVFGKQPDKED
jgi:hypothetical protein